MTATLTEAYYKRLYAFNEPSPEIPIEEFFNPNHSPRDGKFTSGRAWTRPGGGSKVWSGVSADPYNRVVPKTKVKFPLKDATENAVFGSSVYDADLGNGYQARVVNVTEIPNGVSVLVKIRKGHEEAGTATRELTLERGLRPGQPDRLVVHHETLYINPEHQSQGLADKFNAHAVAEYQRLGVDRIDLHAGDTVGGYAWARQGFRVVESVRKKYLLGQLDRLDTLMKKPVLRPHAKKIKAEAEALRKAIEAGEDVQPIHLAALGEKYARHTAKDDFGNTYTTWPGKSLLIGTGWLGQYFFDASKAVTAAATNLEHAYLRSEAFYNKNHDLRNGQFTTGSGGFDGPSAHPDQRTRAVHITNIRDLNEQQRFDLARKLYETRLPGDHRSVIDDDDSYSVDADKYFVTGRIQTKYGTNVGFFERTMYMDEKGNLTVTHDNLRMDIQAQGLGSAFNAHSVAEYRKIGVDRVETYAGDDVGGYAWARAGFRLKGDRRQLEVRELVQGMRDKLNEQDINTISRSEHAAIEKQMKAVERANANGEDVQPIHIAAIGHNLKHWETDEGFDTWAGKTGLLGSVWPGDYYFDYPAHVHASAGFEFACTDKSCAPPPVGTGGSLQARRGVVAGYGPHARKDIRLGSVRVTYKPDYPDDHPDPGEVVWARVKFQENSSLSKDRPVLIIGRINGSDKLAAVQLTSQVKGRSDELVIGPGSWDRLGRTSAVKLGQIIVVDPKDYRREGSVLDRARFESVIGRLATHHRTPVQIAASAMLELACHDASCRPPTSGGTGGSSPSGRSRLPERLRTASVSELIRHYSQAADRNVAETIVAEAEHENAPTLWRGDRPRRVKVGDVIDLHARSTSTDRDTAYEFAFGNQGDDPSALIEIRGARGVPIHGHSVFEQGEWLVAGKFRVISRGKSADEELDQVLVVEPVSVQASALDIETDVGDNFHMHAAGGIEFACHSKACAPPPVGVGGSNDSGHVGHQYDPDAMTEGERLEKRRYQAGHAFETAPAPTPDPMRKGGSAMRTRPPHKIITAAEARGDSRPVTLEEFKRLSTLGRIQLEGFADRAKKINLPEEQWAAIKSDSYKEVVKPWGGATIDLHTGQALPQGVNAYAITAKAKGQSTVSVHENATEAEFNDAMQLARRRFSYTLAREKHYLGVFHDDENHRIDIDPVIVVTKRSDVDTIGAATHAIGGAYNFSDGNGYWPPHVAEG